jgi:hypothetical protein
MASKMPFPPAKKGAMPPGKKAPPFGKKPMKKDKC